jgi:putative addiction module component (TIGR02574 family)
MNPQYTYDNKGNAVGVFLPIDDWNSIKDNIPVEELPQWQKDLIDRRLMMIKQNPESLIPLEDFMAEMEKEADEEI